MPDEPIPIILTTQIDGPNIQIIGEYDTNAIYHPCPNIPPLLQNGTQLEVNELNPMVCPDGTVILLGAVAFDHSAYDDPDYMGHGDAQYLVQIVPGSSSKWVRIWRGGPAEFSSEERRSTKQGQGLTARLQDFVDDAVDDNEKALRLREQVHMPYFYEEEYQRQGINTILPPGSNGKNSYYGFILRYLAYQEP